MGLRETLSKLPPYLFAEIDRKKEEVAKRVEIIDLGVGDPDLAPPPYLAESLLEALQDERVHRYPSYEGEAELRSKAVKWYEKRFGITPDDLIVLIGSKEGIAHSIFSLVDRGTRVLIATPSYPVYLNWAIMLDAEIKTAPIVVENDFLLDPEVVLEFKPDVVVLNYPSNPTTKIAPISYLKELAEVCRKVGAVILYDNAYSEIYFDEKPPSVLEVAPDIAIEFTSLSKSHNVTGWRIGFAAGEKKLVQRLLTVKKYTDSGLQIFVQKAAERMLDDEETPRANRKVYARRRKMVSEFLKRAGYDYWAGGTFFVWVRVDNGMKFAEKLLEAGVVVTPGIGMGDGGEDYIRISLTAPDEAIKEALQRWERLL